MPAPWHGGGREAAASFSSWNSRTFRWARLTKWYPRTTSTAWWRRRRAGFPSLCPRGTWPTFGIAYGSSSWRLRTASSARTFPRWKMSGTWFSRDDPLQQPELHPGGGLPQGSTPLSDPPVIWLDACPGGSGVPWLGPLPRGFRGRWHPGEVPSHLRPSWPPPLCLCGSGGAGSPPLCALSHWWPVVPTAVTQDLQAHLCRARLARRVIPLVAPPDQAGCHPDCLKEAHCCEGGGLGVVSPSRNPRSRGPFSLAAAGVSQRSARSSTVTYPDAPRAAWVAQNKGSPSPPGWPPVACATWPRPP